MIPTFIEEQLPSLEGYLNSRYRFNDQLKDLKQGNANKENQGIGELSLWFEPEAIYDKILVKPKAGEVESKIQINVIDMPGIYHFKHESSN